MHPTRQYHTPSITTYLRNENGEISNQSSSMKPTRSYFNYPMASRSGGPLSQNSNMNNYKPSLSPSPTEMMSNLELVKEQTQNGICEKYIQNLQKNETGTQHQRRSKKRKLSIHSSNSNNSSNFQNNENNKGNCLKKVILSDGSVCFTMTSSLSSSRSCSSSSSSIPSSSRSCSSTYNSPCSNASYSSSSLSILSSISNFSQPPTKKRRQNSSFCSTNQNINISNKFMPSTPTPSTPSMTSKYISSKQSISSKESTPLKINKPELVYSNTMPSFPTNLKPVNIKQIPSKVQNKTATPYRKPIQFQHQQNKTVKRIPKTEQIKKSKSKLTRKKYADWTSKENLLNSLVQQENFNMTEEIFPSRNVPNVNLGEIFHGQEYIRVHKQVRKINERRETQIFNNNTINFS